MRYLATLLLAFTVLGTAWAKPIEIKTSTTKAPHATVTVVHFGATWCGDCQAMEPAWQKFEEAYTKQVNIVNINVDQKTTPEFKQYGKLLKPHAGIPYTVWVDDAGKLLGEHDGGLTADQLDKKTAGYLPKQDSH